LTRILAVTAFLIVAVACSLCTCSVEVNGDKKDMTCGQSACVGGTSFTCSQGNAAEGGDACKTGSSSSSSSGSSSSSSSGTVSSSSSSGSSADACTDLANFCESKCKTNATVHTDCTKTAAAANQSKCVAWQSTNASLCN
jgi:hypothetical protein